jgi:hypothetical protein
MQKTKNPITRLDLILNFFGKHELIGSKKQNIPEFEKKKNSPVTILLAM